MVEDNKVTGLGYPMAKARKEAEGNLGWKAWAGMATPDYQKSPRLTPTFDLDSILPPLPRILEMYNSQLLNTNMDIAALKPSIKATPSSSAISPKEKAPVLFAPEGEPLVAPTELGMSPSIIARNESTNDAAREAQGLMSRPTSDAAPTAIESPATPEVAASQAGAWLTTAVDAILLTEGGYQKDLEDTGNYRPDGTLVGTNRGVTARALAAYKGVDANTITEADIKAITDQDAKDIFIEDYYYKPKIDKLPDNIKEAVFDMNINSGANSITILQRLAGLTGDAVDGGVGPDTLKAIEKANITPDQYADARIKYYKEVVKKTPAKKKYLDGWINRANEYRE